ncbi:MAG: V-type ATPase subunit [Clostridiales bacterium]|nr:V-type ATPase subunit [Clostridiales bacterium]
MDTIYAVTRLHNLEQKMLTGDDLRRLLAAPTVGDAMAILRECGWGDGAPDGDAEALVERERARAWAQVGEMVDMAQLMPLRMAADYHNLKAALKLTYAGGDIADAGRYLLPGGTVEARTLLDAAAGRDFSALPADMAVAAAQASDALLHTEGGQAADAIVDAAALCAIDRAGRASRSALMKAYAAMTVDGAMARIALRAAMLGLGQGFLELALPEAGSLDRGRLIAAAAEGAGAVLDYLAAAGYAGGAAEGRKSPAAMEKWFDDLLMERLRPARFLFEGIDPIVAHLVGREREADAVRLILAAKANHLSGEQIAERLRATYA